MSTKTLKTLAMIGSLVMAAIAIIWAMHPQPAAAADLGGNCCADLEERIAELEATTAHKSNRKVTLTITGQVDAALSYVNFGSWNDRQITQNGNDETYVGFTGQARISNDLTAGYRLEIDLHQYGLLGAPIGGPQTGVRQSYWFVKSANLGEIAVGRLGQATQDLDKWSTNSAWLAGKPLSFGVLSDLYLTGVDIPFDGTYRNGLRYVSPTWEGLTMSASWSPSETGSPFTLATGHGDSYDVAARYANAWNEFKVTGAAGYRHDTDLNVNLLGVTTLDVATGDVNTFLVEASMMHSSGLFLNVNYANQDWTDAKFRLQGIETTGGIETKLINLGKTSVFGTWGRFEYSPSGGSTTNLDYYGIGGVQALDAAAMDLYVGYKHYATGDIGLSNDTDVVNAGARIKF